MGFRLRRGDARFGDLLAALAARLAATAGLLAEVLGEPPAEARDALPALRAAEHEADTAANAVLRALSSAIVTPIDRVDIYRVADALRRAAVRVSTAGEDVVELDPGELPVVVAEIVQLLVQAAEVTAEAVRQISRTDLLTDSSVELHRLGRQARDAHRRFLVETCSGDVEPPHLLRRLALHASLRAAVESFEDLATALQTVAVREG